MRARQRFPAALLWVLVLLTTALMVAAAGRVGAQAAVPPLTPACPGSLLEGSYDYHGLTLVKCNFSGLDLRGANFKGATLTAVVFVRTKLVGADFSGAVFTDSGNALFPNDFTLADLRQAKFTNAQFNGPTYLTHAKLSAADFSGSGLPIDQAVFGEALDFDANASPRVSFAGRTMSCEFVPQWPQLDLTGANGLPACAAQLAGFNFSKAMLAGADLSGIDLRKTKWHGAQLSGTNFQSATLDGATGLDGAAGTVLKGALFNRASARFVDFTAGKLNGAAFTGANLEGADFSNADLSADPAAPNGTAAQFDGASLKNVSLAGATLNSVTFKFASLFGTALGVPASQCTLARPSCPEYAPRTGGTCSCATARGANLTDADFSNAFVHGVDFSSKTVVVGTKFDGAILVAANFADATFQIDPTNGGKAPSFKGAWLQGMAAAGLNKSDLANAFVDFGVIERGQPRSSNALFLQLGADYTRFRNWSGASTTPCVRLRYDKATVLPGNVSNMTCPNGLSYPRIGCGAARPGNAGAPLNPAWNGGLVANAQTPGWYQLDSTYEAAGSPKLFCHGAPIDPAWAAASPPP
jgi:uncharacterized protein YjbI with pentapeptide repeats